MMRHVSTNPFNTTRMRIRTERIASTIGFVACLSSWAVVYGVVCPANPAPAQHHVAVIEVLR